MTAAEPSVLTVHSALLDASGNYAGDQRVVPGKSIRVTITNSNPAVGKIHPATVTIGGGANSARAEFVPVGAGEVKLALPTPAGLSTPAAQFTAMTVKVFTPTMVLEDVTVGQNLQTMANVMVQPAPTSALHITLTSNDPSRVLLSTAVASAGSPSIAVTIPAGNRSASFYVQGVGASGTVSYAANGGGYSSKTGTVTIAPSGVVIAGPTGLRGSGPFIRANVKDGTVPVKVFMAVLHPDRSFLEIQQLRGGASPVNIALTSSRTDVRNDRLTRDYRARCGLHNYWFHPADPGFNDCNGSRPTGVCRVDRPDLADGADPTVVVLT